MFDWLIEHFASGMVPYNSEELKHVCEVSLVGYIIQYALPKFVRFFFAMYGVLARYSYRTLFSSQSSDVQHHRQPSQLLEFCAIYWQWHLTSAFKLGGANWNYCVGFGWDMMYCCGCPLFKLKACHLSNHHGQALGITASLRVFPPHRQLSILGTCFWNETREYHHKYAHGIFFVRFVGGHIRVTTVNYMAFDRIWFEDVRARL